MTFFVESFQYNRHDLEMCDLVDCNIENGRFNLILLWISGGGLARFLILTGLILNIKPAIKQILRNKYNHLVTRSEMYSSNLSQQFNS